MKEINIIGGGLAGSECANYLLNLGYTINLYEMKPVKFSPAHKNQNFAELVCSNSFKSTEATTAAGILKNELTMLNSLLIKIANQVAVHSGSSLSVDREEFSKLVTSELLKHKNLKVHSQVVECFDVNLPTVVATGPLTDGKLLEFIKGLVGQNQLYFFDAIAPIVESESINFDFAYYGNRYNKGESADFINCPMNKEEYLNFYNALITAETVKLKDFENEKVFEGCMPVEVLAKRGVDALRFGPLKPVGLRNPVTNENAYAVVQLRKENLQSLSYNLVGFQTNLTFAAQKKVFSLIPALKKANFLRYGVMHKNSFINAPLIINNYFQMKQYPNVFFAGQISGVEGYIESMASGLAVAINLHRFLSGEQLINFGTETIIGGLANYIATANSGNFQPMGCNIGLLKPLEQNIKDRKEKNMQHFIISQNRITEILQQIKS